MIRLWIPIALLTLLILAIALALRSERIVLAGVHWAVESFTDFQLDVRNPRIDVYGGFLSADEIHLLTADATAPALLSIIDVEVTAQSGGRSGIRRIDASARASQLLVYVSDKDDSLDPTPVQWRDVFRWLPAELRIAQLRIIRSTQSTLVIPLRNVHGRRVDNGGYQVAASSIFKGETLELELDFTKSGPRAQQPGLGLVGVLRALESASEVTLNGEITTTRQEFSYDLRVNGQYNNVEDFLRAFNARGELQGDFSVEGRIRGNAAGFVLSDISLVLDNMPAYGFEAAGEMAYDFRGVTGIRLAASGEMATMTYLVDWIDLDLSELGTTQAGLRLSGSLDEPRIDQFILTTQSSQGLAVKISGNIGLGPDAQSAPGGNGIWVDAQGPSLEVLSPWITIPGADPGPWRASWRTEGSVDELVINRLIVEAGTPDSYEIRLEGSIDRILNPRRAELGAIEGLQLRASLSTPDSAQLSALLGRDIPPFQRVDASIEMSGSGMQLALSNGSIEVSSSDTQGHLSAISGELLPGAEQHIPNVSGRLHLTASDTSALSQFGSWEVPVLGAFELAGELTSDRGRIELGDLVATIDSEDFTLRSRGHITDLGGLRGVSLDNELSHVDTRHLLGYLLEEFDYPRQLGEIQGTFQLSDSRDTWNITDMHLYSDSAGRPLQFSVTGDVADLAGFKSANLDASVKVEDADLWQALTGLRIQPSEGQLSARSTPGELSVSGSARFGSTDVSTRVLVAHNDQGIQQLQAKLHTPHLLLADLGLQSQKRDKRDYLPARELEKLAPAAGIQGSLESLPDFPLELALTIDGMTGRATNIDSIAISIRGENAIYTLDQLSIDYVESHAELRGIIDLNNSLPMLSLAGELVEVPMAQLSQDLGVKRNIVGTLTARGGLTARGVTREGLIGSLSGNLAMALEDTVIKGAAYDVLATDLLAWIYSGAVMENSTYVDCAMGRFNFLNGIAKTDSLFIETQHMAATGAGEFDLVNQVMDLTIVPRSRSRSIQIPSRVRLRGDMSNPRTIVSPISAAADTSAEALLLIPRLVGNVLGRRGHSSDQEDTPCVARLKQ